MQRLAVSSTSRSGALLLRRSLSTTTPKIGTIVRRTKPVPGRAAPGTPEAEREMAANDVPQQVSGEVFRNNMLLAAALVTFAGGVMWYSMHAVGQSGTSPDDPLAALKQEASEAQAARDKESRQSDQATAMLQQFSRGAFDPDQLDEEDEEDAKPKRPWWKFW